MSKLNSIPKPAIIVASIGIILFLLVSDVTIRLFGLFVFLLAVIWATLKWSRSNALEAKEKLGPAVDHVSIIEPLKYKSIHHNTAIGIDPIAKIVHLYQNKNYRAYSFSDIRTWSANIQSGGKFIGGGGNLGNALAMTAANVRTSRENAANTGFFVEVKDIDFPKWKIDFPEKDLQKSHDRWMEIFRQHLNES